MNAGSPCKKIAAQEPDCPMYLGESVQLQFLESLKCKVMFVMFERILFAKLSSLVKAIEISYMIDSPRCLQAAVC